MRHSGVPVPSAKPEAQCTQAPVVPATDLHHMRVHEKQNYYGMLR